MTNMTNMTKQKAKKNGADGYCNLTAADLFRILDYVDDAVFIDDAGGRALWLNKACETLYKIRREEILGRHILSLERAGVFTPSVARMVLERKSQVDIVHQNRDGKRILSTGTPILNEDGNITLIITTSRDITVHIDLQNELESVQNTLLGLRPQEKFDCGNVVANSNAMFGVLQLTKRLAEIDSTVLITGESGVGKGVIAQLLHSNGKRKDHPFIKVNCGAIPENLIESELFGYERGAFTGAGTAGKKGFFELADKGTLLLDEIGDLPLGMQAKLLRVLDDQTFHKVGGEKSIRVDTRIIAATNRPLEELVGAGDFRADLYYRLRVLNLRLPPLREHLEDIPELAMSFLEEACKRHGVVKTFSPKALRCFASHSWPGNVRELRAVVEFLAAMSENSIIRLSDLPPSILAGNACADDAATAFSSGGTEPEDGPQHLKGAVRALEKSMIGNALSKGGSSYKAAKILGISQSTVVRKARELGIKMTE
jgi:PAS domain S-box-containing protein